MDYRHGGGANTRPPTGAVRHTAGTPALRLAVGLGDPEREQALLPLLNEFEDIVITERCLTADQLMACMQRGAADIALIAFDLHRLHRDVLSELARFNTPLVLLAPKDSEKRWSAFHGIVLPLEADSESIRLALTAVIQGERLEIGTSGIEVDVPPMTTDLPEPTQASTSTVATIALASGHGSPGRTTLAINVAAALGTVAPTILVDADLNGPSIAAHLDADPTRNLAMLVHAEPATSREWERAVAQETQPLSQYVPLAGVLCGVPKPAMRSRISVQFFEELIAQLQRKYRYVVLDIGADFLGQNVAVHRLAMNLAQQVLFVASADIPGLWRAHVGLEMLRAHLKIDPDRTALIINRHDRRYHHRRGEIEWALGKSSAAVIPYDHAAVQRAISAQRPLVLDRRSRSGRAFLELAGRIHGEGFVAPPIQTGTEPAHGSRREQLLHRDWLPRRGVVKAAD